MKKRRIKKKTEHDSLYFRSTIIAWGPSAGYAPAKPAVSLTKTEQRTLQTPGLIRESPRNRSRNRALTGMKTERKKRKKLEPIKSPPIESLVTMHDPEETTQKNTRLEPILATRKLEASSSPDKTGQAEDEDCAEQPENSPGFAENDEPAENTVEVDAPLTDAQVFANIADNLVNTVEAEQLGQYNSMQVTGPLFDVADVTELKLMQDILAGKIQMKMDPNEPPPDAQVGEIESGDVPPPSLVGVEQCKMGLYACVCVFLESCLRILRPHTFRTITQF